MVRLLDGRLRLFFSLLGLFDVFDAEEEEVELAELDGVLESSESPECSGSGACACCGAGLGRTTSVPAITVMRSSTLPTFRFFAGTAA